MKIYLNNKRIFGVIMCLLMLSSQAKAISTSLGATSENGVQVASTTKNFASGLISGAGSFGKNIFSKIKTFQRPTWQNSKGLIIQCAISAISIILVANALSKICQNQEVSLGAKKFIMGIWNELGIFATIKYLSSPIALNIPWLGFTTSCWSGLCSLRNIAYLLLTKNDDFKDGIRRAMATKASNKKPKNKEQKNKEEEKEEDPVSDHKQKQAN